MPSFVRNPENVALQACDALDPALYAFQFCPCDDAANHIKQIGDKLRNGKANLLSISEGEKVCGYVAVEKYGSEFVILAAYSQKHVNALETLLPLLAEQGKQVGCSLLTFSTLRPGLIKSATKSGFHVSEIVMRKKIT